MASEMPQHTLQPISLTFHLSCWQNRRARIYVDGVTLDQFPETLDISAFAKHLILSGKDLHPLPLGELNGRTSLFFHHDEQAENVLELQVWHSENGRRCLFEEFGPRSESDPTMRLERISSAKNRFYITLDCDKRLKVQRLVLVAVLRIGGQLFVSDDAHFPPPSSKRGASPRLKGRTGPYETLLSFSDVTGEEEPRGSPRSSPRNSLALSSSQLQQLQQQQNSSSPPMSGRRRASSLKSTSSTSSPRSSSSNMEVHSWQTLVKWLLESRHSYLSGALILQHLAHLSSIAIDFGTLAMTHSQQTISPSSSGSSVTSLKVSSSTSSSPKQLSIDSIRSDLLEWLESGPYHIMELLEGGILQQCIPESWFLGNISEAGAQAYLHWYIQRANLQHAFLVRFSSPNSSTALKTHSYPHLVIEALWTNEQTATLERYSAPVMYDFDPQSKLFFWIETANDAAPSRSHLLAEVVRYISLTTGWPHVWRNPPPPPHMLGGIDPYSSVSQFTGRTHLAPHNNFPAPMQTTAQSAMDSISLQKHRSMPLLHYSPSSTRDYDPQQQSHLHAAGVRMGHTNSPILMIPSRLGILPHDPAPHINHAETSKSGKADETPTFTFPAWSHSQPNLLHSQGHRAPNGSKYPSTTDPVMMIDTGSSESASTLDFHSANSSAREETHIDQITQSDGSSLDFQQDHEAFNTTDGHNHPFATTQDHTQLSTTSTYPTSDSIISGVRSLSAPTALRTWSSTSSGASAHTNGFYTPHSVHLTENGLSPSPYFASSQQHFGLQQHQPVSQFGIAGGVPSHFTGPSHAISSQQSLDAPATAYSFSDSNPQMDTHGFYEPHVSY